MRVFSWDRCIQVAVEERDLIRLAGIFEDSKMVKSFKVDGFNQKQFGCADFQKWEDGND